MLIGVMINAEYSALSSSAAAAAALSTAMRSVENHCHHAVISAVLYKKAAYVLQKEPAVWCE